MLVLHDPATLKHSTIELIGSRLISALECPDRITAILAHLKDCPAHEVTTVALDPSILANHVPEHGSQGAQSSLCSLLQATHDQSYLDHLRTAHAAWVAADIISPSDSILPECFAFPLPHAPFPPPLPPRDIFAQSGYYAFDLSTGIAEGTWESILASANLAVEGVRILTASTNAATETVFALCRPPGHHCDTHRAGGYCYVNNAVVAVAAYHFLHASAGAEPRVSILDLDFHHGNGTQAAFWADPNVQYISIHGRDEYPYYTGSEDEVGDEAKHAVTNPETGGRCNVNLPLDSGSTAAAYLAQLDAAASALQTFSPELLVLSLGFDTFRLDPLGKFDIDVADYAVIAAKVKAAVDRVKTRNAGRFRVLILLEGGYVIDKLGENVASFLSGWEVGHRGEG